jgi:hypothetical protein
MKKLWNKETGEEVELWEIDAREVLGKQGGTWTDDPDWAQKAAEVEDEEEVDDGEVVNITRTRGRKKRDE